MRDSADEHVAVWSTELDWMDPVQEAIIVRLAVLGRHLSQARRTALATGGLEHWQFKVLLALRRGGQPYSASPSALADRLGLTRGALSARLRPLEETGLITLKRRGGRPAPGARAAYRRRQRRVRAARRYGEPR